MPDGRIITGAIVYMKNRKLFVSKMKDGVENPLYF
jgi:hypothetical protein